MAVGVIKLGVLPEEPKLYGICKKCGCEFSCTGGDVEKSNQSSCDGKHIYMICGMGFCGENVTMLSKEAYFAEKNKTPKPDAPRRLGMNRFIEPTIVGGFWLIALIFMAFLFLLGIKSF